LEERSISFVKKFSDTWVLLEIAFSFQWLKNFENPLRFDEVTAMSLVAAFFGTGVY